MSGSDLNISPLYKKTAVIGNLLMICPERVMDFVKIPRVQSDTSACTSKDLGLTSKSECFFAIRYW